MERTPYNYEPEGRTFESCRAHHKPQITHYSRVVSAPVSSLTVSNGAVPQLADGLVPQLRAVAIQEGHHIAGNVAAEGQAGFQCRSFAEPQADD